MLSQKASTEIGQAVRCDRRQHRADRVDVGRGIALGLRRHGVRAQEAGVDVDPAFAAKPPRGAQLAALGREVEAVSRFDLDRGDALGDQCVEAGQGGGDELVLARQARGLHGRCDAATAFGELFVARAGEPQLELLGTVAAVDEMGVAVDEARRDPAAGAVDALLRIEGGGCILGWACVDDLAAGLRDKPVLNETEPGPVGRKCRQTAVMPQMIDRHCARHLTRAGAALPTGRSPARSPRSCGR